MPNHAPLVFHNHYIIPSIHEHGWIDALNSLTDEVSIDYIFPAYDDIIEALAENAQVIKAKVVSSPLETCLLTRSKSKTYELLRNSIPVPVTYDKMEAVDKFPIFLKPDKGQGSQNTCIIYSPTHLESILQSQSGLLIMEYLPGEEFTIDCFSDRESGLLFCAGRERIRTKNGISVSSKTVQNDIFYEYALEISKKLTFYGAWFFQLKKASNGNYKLLEIAPRVAGTMALHRVLGINFPLLSLYEQERIPITILANRMDIEIDRALTNRYKHAIEYDTVYLDLDDMLIFNGKINLPVIHFVYQCINKRIRVVLLTKHPGNIDATLREYRLANIFDEIIHLGKEDDKADFISGSNSILIDDSFSDRRAVFEKRGILSFDCSMLEVLLDERI